MRSKCCARGHPDLRQAAGSHQEPERPQACSRCKTGIEPRQLLRFANLADTLRVKGLGADYAELLCRVGVDTVRELKYRNPANLAEAMRDGKRQAQAGPAAADRKGGRPLDRGRQEAAAEDHLSLNARPKPPVDSRPSCAQSAGHDGGRNREPGERALTLDTLLTPHRTAVMGILNVTPDSFSDGGRFVDPAGRDRACDRMVAEGADILDIGAESTRPYGGMQPVTADDGARRLEPVLPAVVALGMPVSIDTMKAERRGLGDPPGRRDRQRRLGPAARSRHGARGRRSRRAGDRDAQSRRGRSGDRHHRRHDRLFRALARDRRPRRHRARQIVIDPGIGFGKTPEQSVDRGRAAREAEMLRPADPGRAVAQALHFVDRAVGADAAARRLDCRPSAGRAERRGHRPHA